MRVFFPDCIISARSGLCIGWIDVRLHTIYVLAVVHLPFDLHEILRWLQMETITRQRPLTVVGSLTHQGDPNRAVIQQLGRQASERFCLELTRPDVYSLPTCMLLEDCEATSADPVLILYNQRQISACSLPNKSSVMRTSSGLSSFDPSTYGERGDGTVQPQRMGLQIETVLSVIQEGVQQLRMFKDWDISMDVKTQGGIWSVIRGLLASLTSVLVSMGTLVLLPFRSELCHRLSSIPSFQRALTFTQTGCQIQAKYNHVQDLLDAYTTTGGERHTGRGEPVEQTSFSKRLEYLRTCNLFTYLLLDVLLGVSLMCWIHHNSWPDVWAEWIMSSANTTAGSLQMLLQWLMGAPAGLKLNSALAHFLGQFFLYHVYLWIGYLSAMQPVLSWVIWCMSLTGCLGVSVILAVACDMVSMLTFHIYCFYVYAAR
ncbi:phosphatidylinositol N-acetylglucosaminyltransferase subunit Q-like [Acanthaster planci]|uniref:Phosphatidylinositol N-acetylglucosaminyltransferase subunit Q-like n=1 Tax=Acanthaster planci TaxID=133434 RepID=A0A8B7XI89_ACAPL|nr:phosphatidylinositol N-acetylglucosaminyltransferase subunit Q-like [Acanthaster planci]XP_022080509.1 phosphatidylinositol N-acetylglucosaminyltransferase subunit Q-like [Acanthaster planci]XP_022080510.1 phosphatidylinositol N-acetylglucosaminyltransferase subunit Q-like [Acanthaster planci]XP_022080511.1 phosphatidylinositol N-acetylglucosaminyltransferase subunit Q-like [Acanthaster planci]XP_022080512.1 phosphatidylinositol N-acetylglucosaminyltransferase subunit Q-like [Acanthaster pla